MARSTQTIPKFNHEEYGKFVVAYYKGSFPHLRYGQAFFWHFKDQGMDAITDPELFYARDVREATRLIHERYLVN
jgi:Leu/Phe-tRNA-protein transferase